MRKRGINKLRFVLFQVLLFGSFALKGQISKYQYDADLIEKPFYHSVKGVKDIDSVYRIDMNEDSLLRLPREMRPLTNLRQLFFSNNDIRRLPKWISKLENLSIINIGSNSNIRLRPSLKRLSSLPNLKVIWMGGHASAFPSGSFKKFKGLKTLIISKQPKWDFEVVIEEVIKVSTLENLELSFNELNVIPSNLYKLNYLKILSLEYNDFDESQKKEIERILPEVSIIWEPY